MDLPAGHKREKVLRAFARAGLAAHGLVYCLMSVLSLQAAAGFKDKGSGKSEAFKTIYAQPFGKVILFIIGVAMLGYVVLRFFQAFKDTRHKGKGLKALAKRVSYFFIGAAYLSLSYTCINLAFYRSGGGEGKQILVQKAMEIPFGRLIVAGVGIGFVVGGIYQIWRGLSRQFMKQVDLRRAEFKKTFTRIGMVGYTARGVVFGIIGALFIRAALRASAQEDQSTGGAVEFVKANFGNVLMAVVAAGLFAYGLFLFVRARHEKMNFDQK